MKTYLTIALLTCTLFAQERMLLHIGPDGKQEAIPLKKGERAKDIIEQREGRRAEVVQKHASSNLVDTLRYFSYPEVLTTNFGWTHQDVALQWYTPQGPGTIKEFWWLNYLSRGTTKHGTIRAWTVNPRMAELPSMPVTNFMGSYKDPLDSDGGVQPFKPGSGNKWFYSNGQADSVTYSFDPLLMESVWLPGGVQVVLDSNKWQGVILPDWGDSMNVGNGELFGFTITNDTKKTDIGAGTDERMEILSQPATGAPYHSLKYYETGRTAPSNAGWHLRGDYEWGMYVVIEYCGTRVPRFIVDKLTTTTSTAPRKVNAVIDGVGRCSGSTEAISYAYLFHRKNGMTNYDSVFMSKTAEAQYTANIPGYLSGDTVSYFVVATTLMGTRLPSPGIGRYRIYKKLNPILLIYNNAAVSLSTARTIYAGSNSLMGYDLWSAPAEGVTELGNIIEQYSDILVADGNFPARNIYPVLKQRLDGATPQSPVSLFFTSQDYGCYVEANCADTTFKVGSFEYDHLGITKLGPQDLPPTNREFRVVPQSDLVTDYLVTWGTDHGSTLWSDPSFELGFAGYQDAITLRGEATPLFKDAGPNVLGGKYITPSTRVMFTAFDIGALQFRSDTALAPSGDMKYASVSDDVGAVAESFFKIHGVTSVEQHSGVTPKQFLLGQNYPNPFNPATAIEYRIASMGHVTITLYSMLGQKVGTLVNELKEPGTYRVEWNAAHMASGLYFYEMRAQNFTSVKKMLLLK